jgi:hypothetical protein
MKRGRQAATRGTVAERWTRYKHWDSDSMHSQHCITSMAVPLPSGPTCKSVQQFVEDGSNHRVHQRLKFVLLSCPDGAPPKGKSFQALAEEAFKLIPPVT